MTGKPESESTNPYAPPNSEWSASAGTPHEAVAGSFYAMSTQKLWVMSVLTMGIYDLCFWWRHWRFQRDRRGADVWVFWRTVFAPFVYFDLNTRLRRELEDADVPMSSAAEGAPLAYFGITMLSNAIQRFAPADEAQLFSVIALILVPCSTLAIVMTQGAINELHDRRGIGGEVNDGVTAGAVFVGVIGGLLWLFSIAGIVLNG